MTEKTLGILMLENTVELPGFMADDGTFPYAVKRIKVPGATTEKVVAGDQSLREAYARCACQLEHEGVSAITSNCGFTALFQDAVSAAVSVPVGLSSLMLVPHIARALPPKQRIGLLTFDSANLKEAHFAAAGWSSAEIPVSIAGIDGSESWRELLKPVPLPSTVTMISDVMTAVKSLLESHPDIGAFVFECTGFPVASDAVRRETGLPVADCLSLSNMLFEFGSPRKYKD
ncbi:hypothetical protein IVB02_26135 [Bradyrhizobium sp. 166]|uniref:aspartate/glutamate racemase family protein n=1 Tax=Bradyrhizobium sp. 166 TaxID=2782638 RepID=UPI001FF83211|nr:aspartate/glutamate racemase family protein [Bradyrhizobium sp. 166]MCK1604786.1 hypothetical protein [Bradyrhizobium sp. 166]